MHISLCKQILQKVYNLLVRIHASLEGISKSKFSVYIITNYEVIYSGICKDKKVVG